MPKVMLVEDDNNLREIYDARLAAEGYEIVSAHDGEEALALAVKERPDLIISDVMMPKISGFDMLDILRSTPETKNTKVIMMTALGQAEDRARADKLGADRYLVKSQVTLEDVIKVAHEVLGDSAGAPAPAAASADAPAAEPAATTPTAAPEPVDVPVVAAPPVVAEPTPAPTPAPATPVAEPPAQPATPPAEPTTPPVATPIANDLTKSGVDETKGVEQQIQDFVSSNPALSGSTGAGASDQPTPAATSIPVVDTSAPTTSPQQDALSNPSAANNANSEQTEPVPEPPSHKKLVLTPTENALAPSVDLDALLEKENQKASADQPVATPAANTVVTPAISLDGTNPNDISL